MYGPKNGAQAKLSRKLKCPIALYGLAPQHALAQPTSTPLSSVMVRRSIICNSLRRVNAAWLSRSERRAYAYSTLRPPTFSGDSLASAVWLTVRPNGVMKLQDVILKAMAKKLSWGGPVGNRGYTPRSWRSWRRLRRSSARVGALLNPASLAAAVRKHAGRGSFHSALKRGGRSPPGQVPMSPVAWGQAWRGNRSCRSRPDT